jgi:carboxyl-terminal processing protease
VPIVETRGDHSPAYTYRASDRGSLEKIKVAILVNENTASASEILAGAIQDNDRGTIIGRRSFGKGLVQEDFQLKDGSNLRLTIARYYTPTGRCIQKPYTGDYDEYYDTHADRYESGELYHVDSTIFVDSLKKYTPKGKVVYGGGGIMPDVFVPYDSSGGSWYFTELRYTSCFNTFAFDYLKNKRSNWKSLSDFIQRFEVTDALLNQFTRYADKELKVKFIAADFRHSKQLIKRYLKAEIARQIWLEDGYFQVLNETDADVRKAIQILR